MIKIVHIINPVKVEVGNRSYLHIAQPVTFASMLKSKEVVEKDGSVQVELCTTQYEEDREIVPEGFTILPNLTRSCQDVFNFRDKSRKLPLIRDILRRAYDHTDGEWIIYTNADICLSKKFYSEVVILSS